MTDNNIVSFSPSELLQIMPQDEEANQRGKRIRMSSPPESSHNAVIRTQHLDLMRVHSVTAQYILVYFFFLKD